MPDSTRLQEIARDYLRQSSAEINELDAKLKAARATEGYFIHLARNHGLTWFDIANCTGLSLMTVRRMLNRWTEENPLHPDVSASKGEQR